MRYRKPIFLERKIPISVYGGREMRTDHQLDVQGLACPMPIVKTKKTMNTMEVGETVEVIATDAGSKADLQAWAASTGHQYIGLVEEGSVLKHYLRKCNEAEEREKTFEQTASLEEVQNISNDSIVLDVREEVEYAFGHIKGTTSIPFGELFDNMEKLDKTKTYYVICRTGTRSDLACQQLAEHGFKHVYNVLPGMTAYTGELEKTI